MRTLMTINMPPETAVQVGENEPQLLVLAELIVACAVYALLSSVMWVGRGGVAKESVLGVVVIGE